MIKNTTGRNFQLDEGKISLKNDEEWVWLVEYIVQYFNSPMWTSSVTTFMEDNCVTFEDKDEQPVEHFKLHKEFIQLINGLLTSCAGEIGIGQEDFAKAVAVGLKVPEYRTYFEMLFVVDDFNIFKTTMVKKNLQLNLEAIQALQEEGFEVEEEQYQNEEMANEMGEVEYGIQLSKRHEEEQLRLEEEEEQMLMEAIRLSELSFQNEAKKVEAQKMPTPAPVAQEVKENVVYQKMQEITKINQEAEKIFQKANPSPPISQSKPPTQNLSALGALPTLDTRGGLGFKKLPKLEDLEKRKKELNKKLEAKKEMDPALIEERQRKIQEQREKMMEAKRRKREEALKVYEQAEVTTTTTEKTFLTPRPKPRLSTTRRRRKDRTSTPC